MKDSTVDTAALWAVTVVGSVAMAEIIYKGIEFIINKIRCEAD